MSATYDPLESVPVYAECTEFSDWRDGELWGCECDRPHQQHRDCTTPGVTRERYQLERETIDGFSSDCAYFVKYKLTKRGWRRIECYHWQEPWIDEECERYFGPPCTPQKRTELVCINCKGMNSYKAQGKIEVRLRDIHGVLEVSTDVVSRDAFVTLDLAILNGTKLWSLVECDRLLQPKSFEVLKSDDPGDADDTDDADNTDDDDQSR